MTVDNDSIGGREKRDLLRKFYSTLLGRSEHPHVTLQPRLRPRFGFGWDAWSKRRARSGPNVGAFSVRQHPTSFSGKSPSQRVVSNELEQDHGMVTVTTFPFPQFFNTNLNLEMLSCGRTPEPHPSIRMYVAMKQTSNESR